ncbi:MAG: hypothetical protein GKR90_23705 [Pseudomonadales bacterium]|nr:hypothetical protein [Pseudomonadales bacterium]
MAKISCLLWDFGDTLCDERFIWSSGPEWMAVYETFDNDGPGAQWSLGEIDQHKFSQQISMPLGLPPDAVLAHMIECCHRIKFFEKTFAFFQSMHLPQAIVTVNPDLFSEVIVPTYDLDKYCEEIVTSWQEHSLDKRVLGRCAMERMGLGADIGNALLIDNKLTNVEDWISAGGAGYHFEGDLKFERDVKNGVIALA